ncbi:hypothetical protein ATCC90586_001941 [Pythium insidiosum]|nr:hypothetical protein ATCC90586_001941 [Pythium insidiosum]
MVMALATQQQQQQENALPVIKEEAEWEPAHDSDESAMATAGSALDKKPPRRATAAAVAPALAPRRQSKSRMSDAELDIARKLSFSAALGHRDVEEHKVQIVIRIRPPPRADDKDKDDEGSGVEPAAETTRTRSRRRSSSSSNKNNDNNGGSGCSSVDECFRVVSDTSLVAYPPKTSQAYRSTGTATSFQFSRIFSASTAQQELFEATTRPVLDAAFAGKNGLVFAYGVTNSGKTYTITGTEAQPGVLPRALQFVMEELGRRKENEESPVTTITASYVEIYNENVYDLLAAPVRKRRALRIQDCDGKIQVRGLAERPLRTVRDAMDALATGQRNKQVAETKCNLDSSRSHCIFSLYFYGETEQSTCGLRSKVSIVDLAGSERGHKTGATGLRMQEASKINGSLMNLMRCLETLRWNQQHPVALHKMVPFRESKLTRLFQENLIGREQGPLVMIVAVNPSSHEFDETLRTLKYSAMARELVPQKQQQQQQPSNAGGRKSSTSYYDLDGRLRKRRRTSTEGETDTAAAPAALKRDSFGRHMKREPAARKQPLRALRSRSDGEAAVAAAAAAMVSALEVEVENQRTRMLALQQENEELRVQLSQTNAEKLQMEVQIRAEIGNEMREQLQQIKAQYRDMLQQQRCRESESSSSSSSSSSSASSVSSSSSSIALEKERAAWGRERSAMQQKVRQLQEQLAECEDEMQRIQARHQRELRAARANGCADENENENAASDAV